MKGKIRNKHKNKNWNLEPLTFEKSTHVMEESHSEICGIMKKSVTSDIRRIEKESVPLASRRFIAFA